MLLLIVVIQFLQGHEVAHVQFIEVSILRLDLIEVGFSYKASIGEQSLVNCSHLIDAKIGIGDTGRTLPPSFRSGEAHEGEDALHDLIADFYLGEDMGALRVEDMGFQRRQDKGIVQALCLTVLHEVSITCGIAIVNLLKKQLHAVKEISARANLLHLVTDSSGNVCQMLQGIA